MKVAFVFPGQGSQAVGMGQALSAAFPEARAALDEADAALGGGLSRLIAEGPDEELRKTANTQPAILAVSVAAHRAFVAAGGAGLPPPAFFAGHSLGEYSALVAAGAMQLGDAIRATRARGTFMQEAVPSGEGAMAAILGLGPAEVAEACKEATAAEPGMIVEPANFNSPEQTVIAGHAVAVDRAIAACKARGAKRGLPLPVSAPFHCQLMAPVGPRLREVLRPLPLQRPSAPVVANATAQPNQDPARIVDLLLEQVTSPVRWVETVQLMVAAGVDTLVELGPGKVLTGLARRIDKGLRCFSVEDPAGLQAALKEIFQMNAARLAGTALFTALVVIAACSAGRVYRKTVGDPCTSTRQDCAYGLECRVPLAAEPRPSQLDGGPLVDAGSVAQAGAEEPDGGPVKRCQYAFFGECTEDPNGPQCKSGEKCREGHCTVMCAADQECGDGAICKVGVCQRKRSGLTQCYDNRDCPWPESCFHGQCVTKTDAYRCNSDLDCPTSYGYRCINGRCQ